MKPLALVTSYYDAAATAAPLERLAQRAEVRRLWPQSRLTEAEFSAALDGVHIALVSDEPCTRQVLDTAHSLRLIGCDGVGVDHIDLPAATDRGVLVINAPVVHHANGDFVMGMIIAVVRKLIVADRGVRNGEWSQRRKFLCRDVHGCTLGLLGFGRVAQAVARRAQGFDMNVLAYSPRADAETARRLGVTLVSYEELLTHSDILSLHVTLTSQTRGMIGRDELARMKPGSYLINTSRGAVVDEPALIDALQAGHLAGAGLDVFQDEPLPRNHPLSAMDNVVLSPHVGSDTLGAFNAVFECLVDDVERFLVGQPPRFAVNKEVLPRAFPSVREYL